MSTLPVENAKKFTDLSVLREAPDNAVLLIHDGTGVKQISVANLKKDIKALVNTAQATINAIATTGAGAHNAIYRGKNLGTSVTEEQYAAIAAGTFEDLYIGDYWLINGVNWRIAAFDYYLTTGDVACDTHHVTIVPDVKIDTRQMNGSNTTVGGYLGSAMYTVNMATAKSKVIAAFGSGHILTHRLYLDNTVKDGYPSTRAWVDSQIELMSEQNVYGGKLYHGVINGTAFPNLTDVDKSQFPLFAHNPHMISNRQTYWLRNVASATTFVFVSYAGYANDGHHASASIGVRPAFSIKS